MWRLGQVRMATFLFGTLLLVSSRQGYKGTKLESAALVGEEAARAGSKLLRLTRMEC